MAALNLNSDEGGFMDIDHDDSYYAPQQSSSPAKEKNGTNGIDLTHDESDDDDIPVVKKLSAAKPTTQSTKSINISASRPAPPPKVEVKKEPSPISEVPDATWRDLDSTLNVTAAPTSSSSNKASPSDVVETVSVTVKEMVEQEDGTELEIEKTVEKQVVNVFWLDYGEFNGVLGLFGKVLNKTTGQWISCFVKIEGLERCLYFLPRETTTGRFHFLPF
jgi:DNA polymerase alpha subunit A